MQALSVVSTHIRRSAVRLHRPHVPYSSAMSTLACRPIWATSFANPRRSYATSSSAEPLADQQSATTGLSISDKAVKQMKFVNQRDKNPNQLLRVLVESGGCHGYQNKMELTETVNPEDDIIFERDGVRVVVDSVSLQYLRGSHIDFIEELIGSTFQVTDNPNAKHTCGCNISYDIDFDKIK
ncbi:hypothetical protein BC936DRAFT_139788 [Jimgerdemannia flammicorona]|uniref:Core domain-containing protein n=1 Tax=Jimgerdemannia flammicorona TaxID=994334 RepID=A0A433B988_9FUNG|nr:hypothetical protein BC936DRAFT_139788 [Jimgerdemannia flammicorona]